MNTIPVVKLRKSFNTTIQLLDNNRIQYWLGRGLVEQVYQGIIDDDEVNHDIDFHILFKNKEPLLKILKTNQYIIKNVREYKIQILGKPDSRRIEFTFLKDDPSNESLYTHESKGISYPCPKKLFGSAQLKISGVNVFIPYPIDEYLKHSLK